MQTVLQKEIKYYYVVYVLGNHYIKSMAFVQTQAEEKKTTLGERNHTTWEQLSRGEWEVATEARQSGGCNFPGHVASTEYSWGRTSSKTMKPLQRSMAQGPREVGRPWG